MTEETPDGATDIGVDQGPDIDLNVNGGEPITPEPEDEGEPE